MFSERFLKRVAQEANRHLEEAKGLAKSHISFLEEELFRAYDVFGSDNFQILLSLQRDGRIIVKIQNGDGGYCKASAPYDLCSLSRLQLKFFLVAYEQIWKEDGFQQTPINWSPVTLSQLLQK